jgi:hypothetical protein
MDEQSTPTPDPVNTNTPATEAPQVEPVSAPETAQSITPSEPIPETPTAQMAGSEPLPESQPASAPSAGATAEAPQSEIPTQTIGSTVQPEPTPTPVQSAPASMPAQAPVIATPPRNLTRFFLEKAKAAIQLRKQKKLVKIMTLFEKKKHITNDEVEKLLHVSDATATRYLSELEKQNKITQTGKTGHAVTYTKR